MPLSAPACPAPPPPLLPLADFYGDRHGRVASFTQLAERAMPRRVSLLAPCQARGR